jgi:DNA mismatch endonuclease (patch repair protein)
MTDRITKERRSALMASVRTKDTAPELVVRRAIFSRGFRFRLHRRDLPGVPDIVLPGKRVAIFVNGCFWHQHRGCVIAKAPSSNAAFWQEKFRKNRQRDHLATLALREEGWRVLTIWECATRNSDSLAQLGNQFAKWIKSRKLTGEFSALPSRKL